VVQENTQLGEWISEGGAVVELMSMKQLEVAIDLPERYYDSIKQGTRSTVTFEALKGVTVPGIISVIIPLADPQARTFPIRLQISNPDGRIGVGMLAKVELSIGNQYRTTIVPKDAVIIQGENQYAFLLSDEDIVQKTEVKTGIAVGNWIEIQGSVKPGDRMITRGNERLQDGMKVRFISEEIQYQIP